MYAARAADALLPTSSSSTSPAPIAASTRMSTNAAIAACRAACPFGRTRQHAIVSASTITNAKPLVMRWLSSISVAVVGARGTTTPLHSGQ